MRVPAALRPSWWTLKRLTILVGFILTMLGGVGAYVFVEPQQRLSSDADDAVKSASVTAEVLRSAVAQYGLFDQQNSLIFALSSANTKEDAEETILTLRGISLLDHAGAFRQTIGQIALTGTIDYATTYAAYQDLVAKAKSELTLQTFRALKDFEGRLVVEARAKAGTVELDRLKLLERKAGIDREVDRRKLILLVLGSLGSLFLLAASLIATRETVSTPAEASALADESGGQAGAGTPARQAT